MKWTLSAACIYEIHIFACEHECCAKYIVLCYGQYDHPNSFDCILHIVIERYILSKIEIYQFNQFSFKAFIRCRIVSNQYLVFSWVRSGDIGTSFRSVVRDFRCSACSCFAWLHEYMKSSAISHPHWIEFVGEWKFDPHSVRLESPTHISNNFQLSIEIQSSDNETLEVEIFCCYDSGHIKISRRLFSTVGNSKLVFH